ncbi:MAG: hypothetical protein EPN97_18410 [Alphaproteobacteria bacterium]|nr:MAG: hypothetical protein EPN97_18410 [Alphaproteobacteria bacterium]
MKFLPPRPDQRQAFGIFAVLVSLFFMTVVMHGSMRILFFGGIAYGLLFIFHHAAERAAMKVQKPLRAYAAAVVLNGMTVEVLAYLGNADDIAAGKKVPLFHQGSLMLDLVVGLPYYVILAGVFSWALKRYAFTTLQLGAVIFLFWAGAVDEFVHLRALLQGNLPEFLLAGFLMLCTLHGSIVAFEKPLASAYPNRPKPGWREFIILFLLQGLSFIGPVAAVVISHLMG